MPNIKFRLFYLALKNDHVAAFEILDRFFNDTKENDHFRDNGEYYLLDGKINN
jgi:hypothetical protein